MTEAYDSKSVEAQRMMIEALMDPIIVTPVGRVRPRFDAERVENHPRA